MIVSCSNRLSLAFFLFRFLLAYASEVNDSLKGERGEVDLQCGSAKRGGLDIAARKEREFFEELNGKKGEKERKGEREKRGKGGEKRRQEAGKRKVKKGPKGRKREIMK